MLKRATDCILVEEQMGGRAEATFRSSWQDMHHPTLIDVFLIFHASLSCTQKAMDLD